VVLGVKSPRDQNPRVRESHNATAISAAFLMSFYLLYTLSQQRKRGKDSPHLSPPVTVKNLKE
jgi:hypothetical protein